MGTLIRQARTDLNLNLKSVLSQYAYESPKSSTTKRLVNEVLGKRKIDKDDGNFMIGMTQRLVQKFDDLVRSLDGVEYTPYTLLKKCRDLYKITILELQKYGTEWQAKSVTLAGFIAFVDSLKQQ